MAKSSAKPVLELAAARNQKVLRMRLDKETKGAVRYQEIDEHGGKIGTDIEGALLVSVYLRKTALREWQGNSKIPKMLSIAVTVVE